MVFINAFFDIWNEPQSTTYEQKVSHCFFGQKIITLAFFVIVHLKPLFVPILHANQLKRSQSNETVNNLHIYFDCEEEANVFVCNHHTTNKLYFCINDILIVALPDQKYFQRLFREDVFVEFTTISAVSFLITSLQPSSCP